MPALDMLLDDPDLCRDICVLASKSLEAQPRGNWNAIVPRISKNLKQPGRAITAFRRDDAKLSQMPADRIRQHRSLTDQKLPTAMHLIDHENNHVVDHSLQENTNTLLDAVQQSQADLANLQHAAADTVSTHDAGSLPDVHAANASAFHLV
jgi:hypothetical protein